MLCPDPMFQRKLTNISFALTSLSNSKSLIFSKNLRSFRLAPQRFQIPIASGLLYKLTNCSQSVTKYSIHVQTVRAANAFFFSQYQYKLFNSFTDSQYNLTASVQNLHLPVEKLVSLDYFSDSVVEERFLSLHLQDVRLNP